MLTAATFACQQFLTFTAAEFKREFKTKILTAKSFRAGFSRIVGLAGGLGEQHDRSYNLAF